MPDIIDLKKHIEEQRENNKVNFAFLLALLDITQEIDRLAKCFYAAEIDKEDLKRTAAKALSKDGLEYFKEVLSIQCHNLQALQGLIESAPDGTGVITREHLADMAKAYQDTESTIIDKRMKQALQ